MKIQGAGAMKASATGGGHDARFTSAVNGAAHNRGQAQHGRDAQHPQGEQRADSRGNGRDGGRADRSDHGRRGNGPQNGDHDGRTRGNQRFDNNPHGNGIDFGRWPGRGGGRGPDLLGGHGRGIGNDFGFGRGDGRSHHSGFDFRGDLARSATVFTAGPHFSDAVHGRYGEPNGAPASHHLLGLTQAAFRDAAAAVRMAAHTSSQMRDSWRPHMDGYRGQGDLTALRHMSEDYRFLHSLRNDHRGPAELLDAIFEYRVQRQLAAQCMPGTACAPHSPPPPVTGSWLREASFGVAPVPGQVAARLSGQEFSDFAAFTRAFWQAVARTPDLAMTFSEANLARMRQGMAPLAPEAQNVAELRAYMLEHKLSVAQGGEVYDLNNLVILTPAMSQLVADLRYNYAIMNIMYNQFLRDPSDRRRRKHARRRYPGKDEFAFGRWLRKKWQHLRRRRRWRRVQLPGEGWRGRLAQRLLGTATA